MLQVEFAAVSDAGKLRSRNEDYLGRYEPATPEHVRSHGWLFALADGVGGQEKGDVASQSAIETLVEGFGRAASGESHSALLTRLIQTANARVYELGRASRASIATTVVTCALRFDHATVAHAGDSRCYLVRNRRAIILTRDHTVASEQIRLGIVTSKEAAESAAKHVLSRSVGNDLFVNVHVSCHQLLPGDTLLLCSDGLHGTVTEHDIAELVCAMTDPNVAAHNLVTLANARDGSDNVSVQLIRVTAVERVGMYRGRPYLLP